MRAITNVAEDLEKLLSIVNEKDVDKVVSSIAQNETLKSFFGSDKIEKHIEDMAKVLSPQVLYLYFNFINSYDSDIASAELARKIKEEGYDYMASFDRIISTLSRFSPKQQDYILLKSIDTAGQVLSNQITQKLIALSNHKANVVVLIMELLRLLEPFIVRVCQEITNGIITDKQIEEFLTVNNMLLKSEFLKTDTIIEEMSRINTNQNEASKQEKE